MSNEKPGFFKRIVTWTGKLAQGLRWLINIAFLVIFIAIIVNLFSVDVRPLPEKAPLRLVISGNLVEERTYTDPFTQIMEQSSPYDAETPIRDVIEAIDKAQKDSRITGLILDLNHFGSGGIAKMSEIGTALESFNATGKPILAIADNYSQDGYYLASFADEIYVNPMGGVMLNGFGYYGNFFKEAADKLKINVHVFRTGKYKSAVEPFTRNDMSDEAKQNTLDWVNRLWAQYTEQVEQNRALPDGTINNIASNLPTLLTESDGNLATLASSNGLVDQILPRTELNKLLANRFGVEEDGYYLNIHHKDYLRHIRLPLMESNTETGNNIGFIVASGNILDGEQMEGAIGGDSLARLLRTARQDDTLKALVIRVDSPGGSATASDVIRQEILETRKQMPVVISMGSLAASGGYWISAGADEIWAQKTTLTGSIGVFGIIPTFDQSLSALGIHSDGVGTNALSDLYHLDRPMSEEATHFIQLGVENIYRQFLQIVADGRKLPLPRVAEIAEGRVWTGQQAQELGLVDNLGNLDEAVAAAAAKAGLDSWTLKKVHRPLSFQEEILKQLAEGAVSIGQQWPGVFSLWQSRLPGELLTKLADELTRLNDPSGIYLTCFSCPTVR